MSYIIFPLTYQTNVFDKGLLVSCLVEHAMPDGNYM